MLGRHRWSIGLVCALAGSCAWAQDGRINFHGAVMAPTCAAPDVAGSTPDGQRLSCGPTAQIAAGTAVSYHQSVVALADSHPAGDRLLDYFTGYLAPAALAQAKLVVRTYE